MGAAGDPFAMGKLRARPHLQFFRGHDMPKFRKKPVVIEAFAFGIDKPPHWWKDAVDTGKASVLSENISPKHVRIEGAYIETLEGRMRAERGDWIIRGVKGELYPCKPDIFAATYEPA